jgi:hypothetical protein
MKIQKGLIIVVAFLFLIFSSTIGSAQPTCVGLATNPVYGLAGNPVITSATSTLVPASTSPAHAAYCHVLITYSSRGGPEYGYAVGQSQHIGIGIGLPLNSVDGGTGGVKGAWNGKLENLGGGGCVGTVGATTSATDAGYVGTSTDTGHTSAENEGALCAFGVIQSTHQLDLGMIDDFIYEGVHQQVEWGKAVAKTYYGMAPIRNYWNGCSTGGRQGLALAQKWGNQFDGFIIGAPAIYWQEFRLSDAWPALVVKDKLTAIGETLSTAQFNAANAAAIAGCDVEGTDVVADSILDNPLQCYFSATANICGKPGAPAPPNCLDANQAAAIDLIWAGPHNSHGLRIWYPFDRGAAIGVGFGAIPGSTAQVMAYDHMDLTYDVNNLYLDKASIAAAGYPPNAITYEDEATLSARVTDNYMETQDVNLDKVRKHGGKIIMWQGSADNLIRWRDSVDYYRRVATYYGHGEADYKGLQSWFRYYHAPGVAHCGGGVGPSPVNIFNVLVDWVENGIAPDTILAQGGSVPTRTRPLCPWPKTAIYNGSGSTDVASNFHCGGNLEPPSVVCEMLRTLFRFENGRVLDFVDTDGWECPKWDGWPKGWPNGQP